MLELDEELLMLIVGVWSVVILTMVSVSMSICRTVVVMVIGCRCSVPRVGSSRLSSTTLATVASLAIAVEKRLFERISALVQSSLKSGGLVFKEGIK